MINDNCIFCKLANGIIPVNPVYEDELVTVILDAGPASRGHALILPKSHAENLYELDDKVASHITVVAKKVGTAMKKALNFDGLNVVQNNGEAAGQTVMHYHTHLIPRYSGDTVNVSWVPGKNSDEEAAALVKVIKENI